MKHTKHLMLSFAVAAATVTLVSCSDDNAVINPAEAEENEKVAALTAINSTSKARSIRPTNCWRTPPPVSSTRSTPSN